jgi:hypothetical protein
VIRDTVFIFFTTLVQNFQFQKPDQHPGSGANRLAYRELRAY